MTPAYYAPCEVARACGISTKAVLAAIRSGCLTGHRYSARTIRVSRQALADWQVRCQLAAIAPAPAAKCSTGRKVLLSR